MKICKLLLCGVIGSLLLCGCGKTGTGVDNGKAVKCNHEEVKMAFSVQGERSGYEIEDSDILSEVLEYNSQYSIYQENGNYSVYEYYGTDDNRIKGFPLHALTEEEIKQWADSLAKKDNTKVVDEKTNVETDGEGNTIGVSLECENGLRMLITVSGTAHIYVPQNISAPSVDKSMGVMQRSEKYYEYYANAYQRFWDNKSYDYYATTEYMEDKDICRMILKEGNMTNQLYLMDSVEIIPGDGDKQDTIVLSMPSKVMGKRIGEYSILSQDEAKNKLLNKEGISLNNPDIELTEEKIAGMVLEYNGEIAQPVYKCYIELTDKDVEELGESVIGGSQGVQKRYLIYYVPAVHAE